MLQLVINVFYNLKWDTVMILLTKRIDLSGSLQMPRSRQTHNQMGSVHGIQNHEKYFCFYQAPFWTPPMQISPSD